MRGSQSYGEWACAEILREEREILNNETQDKRDELEECYEELDMAKENYRRAGHRELEIELGQGDWRRKPCKGCGNAVIYRTDWEHIPNYCSACKEKFERVRRR